MNPFHRTPPEHRREQIASAAAFACMLAAWVVAYVSLVPADPVYRARQVVADLAGPTGFSRAADVQVRP